MVMRPALTGNARFPRRAGPGLQIRFMLKPRFPEMRLTVDHPGQHPHIDLLPAGVITVSF